MLCTYSLSCWQSVRQQWILIHYHPTLIHSNGLAHRAGTRDIVWKLATLSVQLYFPCTPSSRGVEGRTSAANPLGLSQSPFPLFLPLVLFGLFPPFGLPWKPVARLDTGLGSKTNKKIFQRYSLVKTGHECNQLIDLAFVYNSIKFFKEAWPFKE